MVIITHDHVNMSYIRESGKSSADRSLKTIGHFNNGRTRSAMKWQVSNR